MRDAPHDVTALIARFSGRRIDVAGDLMLDEYVSGDVARISPEAPVPVLDVRAVFQRMGGAANVAHGLAVLGADVRLAGAVGDDDAGGTLIGLCDGAGIDTSAVVTVPGRATTTKTRVVAQHQQLLRIDRGTLGEISAEHAATSLRRLREGAPPDAVVVSDYGKGFLTEVVLRALIEGPAPVLVDPKRPGFEAYRGAAVLTPNRRELEAAYGSALPSDSSPEFEAAGRALLDRAGVEAMLVTLGERGGLLLVPGEPARRIRPAARDVFDVTGAGDTLIATLALALAAGATLLDAAWLAHRAAGVVVGKFGTAVVSREELVDAVSAAGPGKVLDRAGLREVVTAWRAQGRRIVFTNGCFDVLHSGHLSLLRQAAAQGDALVVGINDDDSVRRLRGPGRPLVAEQDRAALVAALECVDAAVLFAEDTPYQLIGALRPDVLVKGADYRLDDVVGRDIVEAAGGRVVLVPLVADRSTTGMIERARRG